MKEITLEAETFHKNLKPLADELGWIIGYRTTGGPDQSVIIESVKAWSGGDRDSSGNFEDVVRAESIIKHILAREQPVVHAPAHVPPLVPASLALSALAPPINSGVFTRFVLPFFRGLGWTVIHGEEGADGAPPGTITITGLVMPNREYCYPKAANALIRQALPTQNVVAARDYYDRQAATASGEAEEQMGELPRIRLSQDRHIAEGAARQSEEEDWEEFDIQKLRENPQNAERLAEYGEEMLIVPGRRLVDTVRDAFARRGWRYGGTSYGNQTVGIHLVVDAGAGVVSRADVEEALNSLCVPFELKSPQKVGKQAAADMEAERDNVGSYLEDGEEEHGKATEEAEGAPFGINLEDDEKLQMLIGWSHKNKRVVVTLNIGDNVVDIGCSPSQADEFLNGAEFLRQNMAEIKKQWETGEGTESETGTPPEVSEQEEAIEDGKDEEQEPRPEQGESSQQIGGDSE